MRGVRESDGGELLQGRARHERPQVHQVRGCFDGRKTWMDLADPYFDDYEDHYKGMEDVRRDYEK